MNRFHRIRALAIVALMPWAAVPAAAEPPVGFDQRVEAIRTASETPGMAVTIVEDGKVVLAKGYGMRTMGGDAPVDGDTIFPIGSTGKAMTSAALATLVDAGKLAWDDRVSDVLPGFQMYDPWVSREITVLDLLVHRSGLGLGAGDLLYIPRGTYSREEIVRRVRHIKPATSFRSGYAYDNLLYVVAGQVVEAVSGESWEQYVARHLFAPAGMRTATGRLHELYANDNRARPHARYGDVVRGIAPQRQLDEADQLPQAAAPAGLVSASANDLARWLQVQLGGGAVPGGGRIWSEAQGRAMWTPVTPIPITPLPEPLAATTPNFESYALGWEVRDYHGERVVWHAGGLYGLTSVVVMLPDRKVGFAIALNSEETEPRMGLMYELLDHYTGQSFQDWPKRFGAYRKARIAAAVATIGADRAAASAGGRKSKPSLPLADYTGRFVDQWYGPIAIGRDARGLTVDFEPTPRMKGRLEHFRYDTFIARFDDAAIEPAYMTFALDAQGKVARITAAPVSPIADFSYDYGDLLFVPATTAKP